MDLGFKFNFIATQVTFASNHRYEKKYKDYYQNKKYADDKIFKK